jgi:hypothetical protein
MRRIPSTVLAVTGLWATLLLGASILWPMGDGYDEAQHVDMAYVYSHAPLTFYGPGELGPTRAGRGVLDQLLSVGLPPKHPLATAPIPDRGDRPSLAELGGPTPAGGDPPNQMVQHPPLGYSAYAAVLAAPGVDRLAWDLQVWVLRLVSVVISLPLPVLCWATARRLLRAEEVPDPAAESLAVVAAVVPLTMPNLVRVCSSVSNDVMLIASTSVLVALVVRVMTGDVRRRVAAGVAAALFVALLSKGFALVLPVLVLAAYLLAARRTSFRAVLVPLAVSAVGGVVGGLWWVHNLVAYGAVQPNGYGETFTRKLFGVRGDADDGTLTGFVGPYLNHFVERIWGGIGLADSLTPGPLLVYGWFAVVATGVVAGLLLRATADARLRTWALVTTVALTVLVAAVGSYGAWQRRDVGPAGAQGRYVYHLVVAVAPVVAVGWARALRPRAIAGLPVLVLAGAVLTNLLSWLVVLRNWYAVDGAVGSGLHGLLRWAPTAPAVTGVAVLVLPGVAAVAALAVLVRAGRHDAPGTGRGHLARTGRAGRYREAR